MIEILHIANDYSGSKVYLNLMKGLDALMVRQQIYTAIRQSRLINKNSFVPATDESSIIYSNILNTYTRINYHYKIKKVTNDLIKNVDFSSLQLIHAHTWYSDGGVAYELFKRFNIPYIVTIRNTDINIFFKYMLHLRDYGRQILSSARRIIFVSPIYLERLQTHRFFLKHKILSKLEVNVIPNGIDEFWLRNIVLKKKEVAAEIKLIYIGRFTKSKNVMRLLKAVELVNKKGIKCRLNLVGVGGSQFNKIMAYIKDKHIFKYMGEIRDKAKLKRLMNECDIFTMPSIAETFGLVYIEALSQGLPVLYTKNEGIYGYYSKVGEAVDSKDINSIAAGIEKIYSHYMTYNFDAESIAQNHNWDIISKKYFTIYSRIVK